MIRNYLTSAWRNLKKNRGYTLINLLGLALGMACAMLIMIYVQHETSYDKFHPHRNAIYLIDIQVTNPQSKAVQRRAIGPYRLAEELKIDFPDFEHLIRFVPQGREAVNYNDQLYLEENLAFADDAVFNIFHFPLITGNPESVLTDPFSLVMSQSTAQKYFGQDNPIGKVVQIRDQDFVVKGIMNDIPENSQFQFDILVSINCAPQIFSRIVLENWGEGSSVTFARLPEGKSPEDYRERLAGFTGEKLEAWSAFTPVLNLTPLPKLYLHSKNISGWAPGGDITYVIAFSFIAFFILLIACINFMNLATARSSLRAREVGLRKVVGAKRSQLIGQFLSESMILALVSLLIAIGIVWSAMPFFNQLANKELSLNLFSNWPMLAGMVGITLFVGIGAGSYPAFLLSGFQPVNVLANKIGRSFKGASLRKVLVVFQFATSIFLLIVTIVVYNQLDYCNNLDLGYDRENLVVFGTPTDMRGSYEQFRAQLMSNPKIINAGPSSRVPPGRLSSSLRARPEGVPEDQQRGMQTVWTDYSFIETMGFELASGRSFSREYPSDAQSAFILNEEAVKQIGWTNESAIGKGFGSSEIKDWNEGQWQPRDGKVIGVLKDFYFESLKQKIVPTVYFIAPYMAWNYVVRIQPQDIPGTIDFIEEVWDRFNEGAPFEYTFVDESFAQLYDTEQRQGRIFTVFAILAIFIACLGLIGLAAFSAERKKKEVGIRKVLGATPQSLIFLLSKEFTILVVVAFVIAAPIAWYIMQGWLQDFVYRISIPWFVFIFAGGVALFIAWITVGYQTLKTAYLNPVKSIRSD